MATQKSGGGQRKYGRNKEKCSRYRAKHARCADNKAQSVLSKMINGHYPSRGTSSGRTFPAFPGYILAAGNTLRRSNDHPIS